MIQMKRNMVQLPHFSLRQDWCPERLNGLCRASRWHLGLQSVSDLLPGQRELRSPDLQPGACSTVPLLAWTWPIWARWLGVCQGERDSPFTGLSTSEIRLVILTQMANYLLAAFIWIIHLRHWSGSGWLMCTEPESYSRSGHVLWGQKQMTLNCSPGIWGSQCCSQSFSTNGSLAFPPVWP